VRAQSLDYFELLVLDDANDVATQRYVFALSDERIRYIPARQPLGPAANHARCLRLALGELTAIINPDDRWRPDLLARLVEAIDSDVNAAVAFADHGCIDANGVEDAAMTQ
jgi:GT2 family glycosyltransferase